MSKYLFSKNALTRPWTESPFFYKLLCHSNYNDKEKKQLIDFHENGYLIIDLKLKKEEINNIIKDTYKYSELAKNQYVNKIPTSDEYKNKTDIKLHSDIYTFTESPRLFEGWKNSKNIKDLTTHPDILKILKLLYNKTPFPFSTINFTKGSGQPYHSDTIHFHTIPYYWMTGVWIALEDVDSKNGALQVIPKSHRWDLYNYNDLNLKHPDEICNGEELNYREYEHFIKELIKVKGGKDKIIELKKGEAIIWAANLLHGGIEIKDQTRTRHSQVNHYFYKDCKKYYHPMFSQPLEGIYANKWCDDKNNISTI
tara:strand:- start:21436 stop:22368 length:933 start_codon:yes stop_codon:yes gene_type:complete